MEQFNLEKYLENPSHNKVVTRDGRSVRIVCWDSPNKAFPIVGFVDNSPTVFVWDNYGYSRAGHVESKNDLFFADEEKTNKILDELKSYLKNTPKEQVEKDWKEIQDWYAQHFTNEEYNEKEELTEFEKELVDLVSGWCDSHIETPEEYINKYSQTLLDLARKEILKDLPKWKKCIGSTGPFIDDFRGEDYLYLKDYVIKVSELEKLPKEE